MDKLKLHSPDITEQNIAKLAELFPNCVTETRNSDGEVKQVIDSVKVNVEQIFKHISPHTEVKTI